MIRCMARMRRATKALGRERDSEDQSVFPGDDRGGVRSVTMYYWLAKTFSVSWNPKDVDTATVRVTLVTAMISLLLDVRYCLLRN